MHSAQCLLAGRPERLAGRLSALGGDGRTRTVYLEYPTALAPWRCWGTSLISFNDDSIKRAFQG
jgi:hypothetical protein